MSGGGSGAPSGSSALMSHIITFACALVPLPCGLLGCCVSPVLCRPANRSTWMLSTGCRWGLGEVSQKLRGSGRMHTLAVALAWPSNGIMTR